MRTPPLELAAPVRLPPRRVQAVVQLPLAVRLPSVAAPGPLSSGKRHGWEGGCGGWTGRHSHSCTGSRNSRSCNWTCGRDGLKLAVQPQVVHQPLRVAAATARPASPWVPTV